MICAKCNLHYPDHLNFCRRCGNPLIDSTDESVVEALCCTRCGGRFIHGENFCQQCGHRLSQRSQETVVGGCYGCGTSWRSGWLYCRTCGLDRDQALMGSVSASAGGVSSASPAVELEVEEIERVPCPSCGETIKPYSRFCEVCGGSISPFSRPMSAAFHADLTGMRSVPGDVPGDVVSEPEPVAHEAEPNGLIHGTKKAAILPDIRTFIDDGEILELEPETVFAVGAAPAHELRSSRIKSEDGPLRSESGSGSRSGYGVTPRVRSRITESTSPAEDRTPRQATVSARKIRVSAVTPEGSGSKPDPSATAGVNKVKVRTNAAWQAFGIVTVVVIILVLLASWWMMRGTGMELTKPLNGRLGEGIGVPASAVGTSGEQTAPVGTTQLGDTGLAVTVPEGMVIVRGGIFRMGREDGAEVERPVHEVRVAPFFIDRTEVTNEQYLRYVRATGVSPPRHWSGAMYPTGRSQFPVVNVSWNDAKAFAEWAGKRLPSEAEWEFAARGLDGRFYPWGNDWSSLNSNSGQSAETSRDAGLVRVGSFPGGLSPFGVADMAGNVWEWTSDKLISYTAGPAGAPGARQMEEGRVIRGGAYDTSPEHSTTTFRGVVPEANGYDKTGFRCVRSVQSSAVTQ
ncbi:MAG: SUMF1/EgtB/PvdO family nonheme iron enzyme [Blastocatellia bacterium]